MNNTKQQWRYHGVTPVKGRKLLLLQADELLVAIPLMYRIILQNKNDHRLDWFNHAESKKDQELKFIALSTQLSLMAKKHKDKQDDSEALQYLNVLLNDHFSDYGWRMIRKELAQIKKRRKKSHIELSNDLIYRLKRLMSLKQLDSFDQTIDYLLSENEDNCLEKSKL